MDNATKNKLVSGTDQADLTTGNACWETPPLVFAQLEKDFGPFDVDLTADARRALCAVWLGPTSPHGLHATDALQAPWIEYGRCGYSNPPYGPFIQTLLPKAKAEAARGFTSVLLLPLRVTRAFKLHVLDGASDLLFCDTRITFFEDGVPRLNAARFGKRGKKGQLLKGTTDPAVFDSIIVRYRPGVTTPHVGLWRVPKHVTALDLQLAIERRKAVA